MITIIKGILVDALEKEYEFEGKKGISYQLVIYSEGNLNKVKVPQEIYKEYVYELNKEIELECNIFIKGSYSLTYRG